MTGDASRTTTRDWELPAPRHRWRGRDVFYFILAYFLLNIIVSTIIGVLPFQGESAGAMRALAGKLFVELTLIGMTAFLVHFAYRLSFFEEMRWARNYEANNGMLLALGAGLAVSVMIVSTLFPPSSPPIERMLSTPGAIALFAVVGIAFAPFLEEIMFRGYLFRVIEDLFNGSVAVRATALMFAMMHVPQLWGSWAGMFVIFGVGYILSELRERSGSVIPCVVVHTAYNGMLFLAYILGTLAQGSA